MGNKSLVILSGGQDSATCLFLAKSRSESVEAISFIYGQNHVIEMDCAARLCQDHDIKHTIVDISFFKNLIDSALTTNGDVNALNSKGLPASFVPNRNALFITLAHAYAQKIGANTLYTGVCQTDYSGYPDCRLLFITTMGYALNNGSDSNIVIETPLMYATKADTWKLADELGVLEDIKFNTHTCYNGVRSEPVNIWGYGCGTCPACELRKKGYHEFAAQLQK